MKFNKNWTKCMSKIKTNRFFLISVFEVLSFQKFIDWKFWHYDNRVILLLWKCYSEMVNKKSLHHQSSNNWMSMRLKCINIFSLEKTRKNKKNLDERYKIYKHLHSLNVVVWIIWRKSTRVNCNDGNNSFWNGNFFDICSHAMLEKDRQWNKQMRD